MAERKPMRSERRDEGNEDPFADLARIIGFDPRVKMQPSAGPIAPAEVARNGDPEFSPALPAAEDEPAEHLARWEDAFSHTDLTLEEADVALGGEDAKPALFDLSDLDEVAGSAPEVTAAETVRDEAGPAGDAEQDRRASLPADFETAAEIDLVTQAFERAWQQTNQWSTEIEAKDFRIEVPAALDARAAIDPGAAEKTGDAAAPADELSAIELLGDDLDDVLAESIERDLEDVWLQPLDDPEAAAGDPERAAAPLEATVSANRAQEPVEAVEADADVEALSPALDFEEELRAVLDDAGPQAPQPEDATYGAAGDIAEAPGMAAPAADLASTEASAEAAGPVEPEESAPSQQPAPTVEADALVPEPTRPRPFSLDVGPLDDDPFAALAAMAERYRSSRAAPVDNHALAPAPADGSEIQEDAEVEDMKRLPSARYEMPEIETFDVPEQTLAAADDLDFPEMPFEEPQAARGRRGGVDAEFEDLLEEMSSGEPARQAAYQPRQTAYAQSRAPAQPVAQTAPPRGYEQTRPVAQPRPQSWEMEQRSHPREESETFFDDQDMAEIAADGDEAARPRKRGKWLAALFGSVVIAGGAGAFAMKFTGLADGGLPILVKADASPIKIRPDKPGGAAVPNQDNEVYDRVAGNAGVTPAQERLLTSAEEPVSLDDQGFDDDALPGLDMGEEIDAAPEGKAEDRLADDAAEAPRPSEEPIAVTPRKVRTVAVRADGTLVQEEPAPVVETLVASAGKAIDTVRAGSAGVDATDSTNSIAPAASDDQAALPSSAAGGTAAPKVIAAQAAGGAWSMQIASQPSEDAARSSYADLAKRYSALLDGRDVNIVKTEIAGKGTFWRVRVPAETRSAAVDLCTSFKAAGGNCFVSR